MDRKIVSFFLITALILTLLLISGCGSAGSGIDPQTVAGKLGMELVSATDASFPEEISIPLESREDGCLDGYRSMETVTGRIGGAVETLYLFHYGSHESVGEAMTLNYSGTNATIAYGDDIVLLYYGGNPTVVSALRKNYTIKQ